MATAATSSRHHYAKTLSQEEIASLEKDHECLSQFKREKLEKDAKKNWDLFYKRNSTNFFKDRHWITREFPEILQEITSSISPSTTQPTLLEAGCGVGNTVFPLHEEQPNLFIHACDFSPIAVELLQNDARYDSSWCHAFQCDLTMDSLSHHAPNDSVDLVLLIFVLSAISPDKMSAAIRNIGTVLKPGGMVLFRDYGLYDHAMLRFSKGHKISEQFYVRQDGTRAYYFSEEETGTLFREQGFEVIENSYVQRLTLNKKEDISAERIFIQGKFRKLSLDMA